MNKKALTEEIDSHNVPRSVFLSWLGLGIGGSFFGSILGGMSNVYHYRVKHQTLSFDNLPKSFKDIKIVQISDIHSGSLRDKTAVEKGVDMAMALKPDLIFFTGDLVNSRYEEFLGFEKIFGKLKAPMGVYSCLGNHDYGDHEIWHNQSAREENNKKIRDFHAQMGWRLLLNEHVELEKDGEKIGLLGVENWSAYARFPKYGKLDLAHKGTEYLPFKILLSHDPSHWDAQIRKNYPDIDLTLSGHTHGMQFGLETPFFKWSPVQWFYKQWCGLYEEGRQKIYVNTGYGFIGYPGRVGILPEITLFEFV